MKAGKLVSIVVWRRAARKEKAAARTNKSV